MRLSILLAITLLLSVVVGQVKASEAALNRFFTEVKTLTAQFAQVVVDESGMTLEQSSGTVFLSRPGKFRWDYKSQDSDLPQGQQIIADGQYIYMYDPDLEQVTRRGLKDAMGQVPSLLLVQSGTNIEEHFLLTDFGLTDGLNWVALKPIDEDAGYQQLMIGFKGEQISQLMLLDGLGNETRLQLSQVQENVDVAASVFNFDPPENTDVLFQ